MSTTPRDKFASLVQEITNQVLSEMEVAIACEDVTIDPGSSRYTVALVGGDGVGSYTINVSSDHFTNEGDRDKNLEAYLRSEIEKLLSED